MPTNITQTDYIRVLRALFDGLCIQPSHIKAPCQAYLVRRLCYYMEEESKLPSNKDLGRWQKAAVKKFSAIMPSL